MEFPQQQILPAFSQKLPTPLNDIYSPSLQVKRIYRTETLHPLGHTVTMTMVRKDIKQTHCIITPKICRLYVTRFIYQPFSLFSL